jgi:hypothetical protein
MWTGLNIERRSVFRRISMDATACGCSTSSLEREIMGSSSTSYLKWLYFSVRGRIGRQAYWLFMVLPFLLTGIVLGFLILSLHIPFRVPAL